jgi:hypothetical protein
MRTIYFMPASSLSRLLSHPRFSVEFLLSFTTTRSVELLISMCCLSRVSPRTIWMSIDSVIYRLIIVPILFLTILIPKDPHNHRCCRAIARQRIISFTVEFLLSFTTKLSIDSVMSRLIIVCSCDSHNTDADRSSRSLILLSYCSTKRRHSAIKHQIQ